MSASDTTQDRNITAAVCRSTPNGLSTLNSNIDNCTTSTEQTRNQTFAANNFNVNLDVGMLAAAVGESLAIGDSIFGQGSFGEITNEVKTRNLELQKKKQQLMADVDKAEATIQRSDRDFSDVKDTLPETQSKKVLHFIEDYTLAILVISYLFMAIAGIYVYTLLADKKLIAFGKSLIGSILLSCFGYMLLYYFS